MIRVVFDWFSVQLCLYFISTQATASIPPEIELLNILLTIWLRLNRARTLHWYFHWKSTKWLKRSTYTMVSITFCVLPSLCNHMTPINSIKVSNEFDKMLPEHTLKIHIERFCNRNHLKQTNYIKMSLCSGIIQFNSSIITYNLNREIMKTTSYEDVKFID